MDLYTHTAATNLAVTSVYPKVKKELEPNQSGLLRSNMKHKDQVEVYIGSGRPSQNLQEVLSD